MKFSIIIPVYNGAAFIKRCLESVLSQSCTSFEAIVVDDGSTDDTAAQVKAFCDSDPRVKYCYIENSGVTAARKTGIDKAAGEWICFLDVDDRLPCTALETYSAFVEDNPDIVASGEKTGLTLTRYKAGLMQRKSHPELWGKLFKASLLKSAYPLIDRSVTIGEDQIINLVLANTVEKLVTIPELQYCYNVSNSGSVTKRFSRTADYEIKFEKLFDRIVLPSFDSSVDELKYAEYKMKIEGFKMVVLDGNNFNPECAQWRAIKDYYALHASELASSERLFIRLERCQRLYSTIMRSYLFFRTVTGARPAGR